MERNEFLSFFSYEKLPHKSTYDITLNYKLFPIKYESGSYRVIAARVMGLTFAEYLRMCRDIYGASLFGKNCIYITTEFKDESKIRQLVKILNERTNEIMRLLNE